MILLFISLIIIPGLILGFRLTKDPVELVEISLNKKEVNPSDNLVLHIKNKGFKWLEFGSRYWIYRKYSNGSIKEIKFPPLLAWTAEINNIGPIIGSYQQIIYIKHLEPGDYFVTKEFTIKGLGNYSKSVEFTIK